MRSAIIYSTAICAIGAALEAIFAGKNIKQRLANLPAGSLSVPFWGWMMIGVVYYLVSFGVLYRLFLLQPSLMRSIAFVLVGAMMFINAIWNHFFFRSRNLLHTYLLGLLYTGIALCLFLLLQLKIDVVAAEFLIPYLPYLCYANVWSYRIRKLESNQ